MYAMTEDAHAPMLQYVSPEPTTSRQRHPVGEDSGSFDGVVEDEQLATRTPYMHNNRF
jgi:hypothetical protein